MIAAMNQNIAIRIIIFHRCGIMPRGLKISREILELFQGTSDQGTSFACVRFAL